MYNLNSYHLFNTGKLNIEGKMLASQDQLCHNFHAVSTTQKKTFYFLLLFEISIYE